jgi:K+-transporting ATPase, c chain
MDIVYVALESGAQLEGPRDDGGGAPEGRRADLRRHGEAGPGRYGDRVVLGTRPRHLATQRAHPGRQARGIPVARVLDLISKRTDDPTLGFIGTTRINVLDLNLALDKLGGA